MASLNKVILMGNMTRDPELRQTSSGVSVCSFSIAVNRPYKSGEQQAADFIDCVAWRQAAEFVSRYFRKGSSIIIDGHIETRTYTDRVGNKRTAVEIIVNEASFGANKATEGENYAPSTQTAAQPTDNTPYTPTAYTAQNNAAFEEIPDDESLPF
jgi:single-strand DNA-binding protein